MAKPDGNEDVRAYQAAVYGNDTPKKKNAAAPKFPTYDEDTLAAYLSLPRRGTPCSEKQTSENAAAGKFTLPFSADMDRAEQLIIIEDTAAQGSTTSACARPSPCCARPAS